MFMCVVKNTTKIAAIAAVLFTSANARATWVVTETYYAPQTPPLNNLIINNLGVPVYPVPGLNLMANNLVNPDSTMAPLDPDVWSAFPWTALDPTDRTSNSQRALKLNTATHPNYGATAFQKEGLRVGMHLNTHGPASFPGNVPYQSLQYRVDFANRNVWNTSHLLCMSGTMNIATSYSGGSVNQVGMAMNFVDPADNPQQEDRAFYLGVGMFDSRSNWAPQDGLQLDTDPNSGNDPIVLSFAQTQGQNNSVYTSPIPGYGNLLEPYRWGAVSPGDKDRGFCISPAQFTRMLTDINQRFGLGYSTNPANYQLRFALVGPEIFTGTGRGHIGMNVSSLWIYRRADL